MPTQSTTLSRPNGARFDFAARKAAGAVFTAAPAPRPQRQVPDDKPFEQTQAYVELKVRLHQKLLELINLSAIEKLQPHEIRAEVGEIVKELLLAEQVPLNSTGKGRLIDDILDELVGLGPLEPLLKDPTVNDILVNSHSSVYVERAGKLEPTAVRFKDARHLLRIIDKIVSTVGRRVDESQPMVDARLPDGSRVNAVIPPVALDGPIVSIRKFSKIPYDIDRLIEIGTLTPPIAALLRAIVRGRLSLLISGGTGTGKTTFLNAISTFISHRERIVTIEDAAELQLQQPHVVRMETRPANTEGRGEITQRELVKNSLRMRPDRIILGEVRAGEAFDVLQAMNTGHNGSITTIHSNSPRDALARLEQMVSMTGLELPTRSVRGQIASALDVVIQLHRHADGRRRLVSLQEIVGMEGDVLTMQEIFRFEQHGVGADDTVLGETVATGIRPAFADQLAQNGLALPADLFDTKRRDARAAAGREAFR